MLKALLSHFQKFKTLASRSLDPFRKVKRHRGEALSLEESQSLPTGVASSLSVETGLTIPELVPPDPCQPELDELGGTDAGVRHVHGRLGTEATGGCGGTGVLQECESGVGLKF